MKTIINTTIAALALTAALPAQAQQVKTEISDGHIAPLSGKITYRNGKSRNVTVVRSWYNLSASAWQELHGVGEGGADVKVWLDSIAYVKDTSDKEFTVVLRSGTERTLGYNMYYMGFVLQDGDGGSEYVPMTGFKTLEFFGPCRKDSRDFAMFDQWKFSPYTGEKLVDIDR
ncbi:MAG: hypothetical protein JSS66_17535 [Armatimonadetes bacterium]|nr:hypothetical protein [Armatimonadota bacterium]